MNTKYSYIFTALMITAIIAGVIYFFNYDNTRSETIDAKRLSAEIAANDEKAREEEAYRKEHPTETEIASFSTPLLDKASRKSEQYKCNLQYT